MLYIYKTIVKYNINVANLLVKTTLNFVAKKGGDKWKMTKNRGKYRGGGNYIQKLGRSREEKILVNPFFREIVVEFLGGM